LRIHLHKLMSAETGSMPWRKADAVIIGTRSRHKEDSFVNMTAEALQTNEFRISFGLISENRFDLIHAGINK
jgi:hypothetical protein